MNAVAERKEFAAVAEHLTALYDTRDMCLDEPTKLAEIDRDIAEYARRFPDAFAQFVKFCEAREESIKAEEKKLRAPYQRKAAMWCARGAAARELALRVVEQFGDLEGEVYAIAKRPGRQHLVIDDPDAVPAAYKTVIPEQTVVDEKRVEAALKSGVKIPGARLERYPSFVEIS